MTSKCGKNKTVAHEAIAECVTDVLTTFWRPLWSIYWTDARQHGIYLFYTITSAFFSKSFSITRKPAFDYFGKHEKKPFDEVCCLYKMKQSHWLLCRNKELWLFKNNYATLKLDSNSFSWNENLQRKQNWTAKSTNVKENAGKSTQFLSSEQLCKPRSLDVVLNIAGVERIRSENLRLRSTLEAIWLDGGNLCLLWLVILKWVWHSIGETL